MKYKIEKILTITGLVSSILATIASFICGEKRLALAWSCSAMWAFSSLMNLVTNDESKNAE